MFYGDNINDRDAGEDDAGDGDEAGDGKGLTRKIHVNMRENGDDDVGGDGGVDDADVGRGL